MIEYLKKYKWSDFKDALYPLKDGVRKWNPPAEMKYCSRELNGVVVFFKTEGDMIAFDNRNEDLNDKTLTAHGKSLARKVYD